MNEKQKLMLKALEKTWCNISESAKIINISRSTHYEWLDKSDTYKKEFENVKETFNDNIESEIIKKALDGDNTMLIFYAKTKMKHRGYTEKQILVYEDIPPIKIEFEGGIPNFNDIEEMNENKY